MPAWVIGFIVFIFGSLIGSFLNVCIYRLPKEQSIVMPPSHCPECKAPIQWYDNIPILSFIILRGKCRVCKAPIRPRYLAVELITALLALALFLVFGLTPQFAAYAVLSAALIVATFVDFEIRAIPDEATVGGLIAGLIFAAVFPSTFGEISRMRALFDALLGMAVGGIAIYITGLFGKVVFKKEAMGEGDVFLMAMIGSFLGWKLTLFTFFAAPILGLAQGIAAKLKKTGDYIPYGPYLSMGAIVAIFWGQRIIELMFGGL
jgi:leader peptidase (prepilin peptidase)/N-methyltransferase